MAPVNTYGPLYPHPTYSTIMSAATTSSDAFVTLTLGCSVKIIDFTVPSASLVQAAPDLKARCLEFLSDLLLEHSLLFSSAKLIAASGHIPSSSYNATLESSGCCTAIRSAISLIDNLVAIEFRDHSGPPSPALLLLMLPLAPPVSLILPSVLSFTTPPLSTTGFLLPPFYFKFWLAPLQTILVSPSPAADSPVWRLMFTSLILPSTLTILLLLPPLTKFFIASTPTNSLLLHRRWKWTLHGLLRTYINHHQPQQQIFCRCFCHFGIASTIAQQAIVESTCWRVGLNCCCGWVRGWVV